MKHDNTIYFARERLTFNLRDPLEGEHFTPEFINTMEFFTRYSRLFPEHNFLVACWSHDARWESQVSYWIRNGNWSEKPQIGEPQ